MKRWIRCVPDFVMLVVFSMICAQTVMAAETGTTTDPIQQEVIKPETEIGIIEETESEAPEVYYRVVLDDMMEGAQAECPDQAAAGETVPVLVRADGDHSIRRVVANYYDASFEGHQIEMDPLMEDEEGIHYEFIMPDADVAIFVMTEALHGVTVLQSDGGKVTASRDRAGLNDSVALTAEPEEGYRFAGWEVYEESGSQIGVRSDNTFLMGFEAVTVRAIFEKLKAGYSIMLTQSGEGTIVSSREWANAGETVTVTPSAQSGYRLERITVTPNTPGAGIVLEDTEEKESYSFTMPEGDVTVHVQFDKITDHVVRVIWDDVVADRPQQVIVLLQKKDGNSWVYGGTSVSLSEENVWTSRISLEQQSMPEGEWRFRLINDQEGTVHAPDDEDADGTQAIYSVTREGSIDLYAVYQHVDYAISDTGTEIRLGNPSISPKPVTYTVTASVNDASMGSVTGAGTCNAGATVTLTATANEGYSFVNWTEDETEVGTNAVYEFTASADRTLVANFTAISPETYTLTVEHGTGGGSFAAGTEVIITADPSPDGQVFDQWTGSDGITFADAHAATTTFAMPAQTVTVTASYREKNTEISNQGGNGQSEEQNQGGNSQGEAGQKEADPVMPVEEAQLLMNAKLLIDTKGSGVAVWCGNVSDADRYEVYAEYCGKRSFEKVGEIPAGAGKVSFSTLHGKKLNRKKNIQAYVLAYRGRQLIAKSMTVYAAGSENKQCSNVRKIRTDKNTYKVKAGKTKKIKASAVYKKGKKKQLSGRCKAFRYASSDPSIATVNKNGKIKGKKRGTCTVWVYAKNGCSKKVKVIVR